MDRTTWVPGILAVLLTVPVVAGPAASDPQAVLRAIEDNHRGGSGRFTIALTVVRPGRQTEYVLEIWSDGEDRGLAVVRSPAREAGQAFLRVGNNLWLYAPRLRRTLRLPPSGRSESFLGSDISYADLAGRDVEQDYTPRIVGTAEGVIVLELQPRPGAPTPYGKLVVRAQADTYAPLEWVFFDQRGRAVKRITFADHTRVGARLFPTRIVVEDLLREGYRTTVSIRNFRFGAVSEACFTLQALEQGCE
ncbi:MAG: outer membrane lipoprotein-sorting protein [Armatimonadota bacterium]|nr:outer membrane lipoprotein-sorting protein [Armatimonadota bacterium]MDR7529108.1 outer membrane lipoprotein-sorting protein [Armatimonadota bacterium]MDR7548295.1 outer membrane lipoprotein-sorting protein [Armatimonadota bacterium]